MTDVERIAALVRFGYSEVEASFLCLAALQGGGYFVRRQFASFIGGKDGGRVSQLVQKALAHGHLKCSTWRRNAQLYHLSARPFYEALGQGENRNRRPREVLTIKNRLMGLDFVLAHRDAQYLATEQEKFDYFTRTLGLDPACLPAKLYRAARNKSTARYFVDKHPLFISPAGRPSSSAPAGVSFVFVDEGAATLSRFESYLEDYASLFGALRTFGLIYVAAERRHFHQAERLFERFLRNGAAGTDDVNAVSLDRIFDYFMARRRYEAGDTASFDRARLIELRDQRREFSGAVWENLYARWRNSGDRATLELLRPDAPRAPLCAAFSTFLLEHDYDLFGPFPG